MQCYHVYYVPVEPLSHSPFPLTANPLGLIGTSLDPAGQFVFNMLNLELSYFVVLSTMSLKSLTKSGNCCIRKGSNSAEDIQTAVCDCSCGETDIFLLMMYYGICSN